MSDLRRQARLPAKTIASVEQELEVIASGGGNGWRLAGTAGGWRERLAAGGWQERLAAGRNGWRLAGTAGSFGRRTQLP